MVSIDSADLISITEANQLGVSELVREAEAGHERVVLRNNKPVAAVVSMKRLEEMEQLQDELLDISLAAAHLLTAGSERYSLDEVFAAVGYTREQIRELPE